jgi:ATP-dependent DNA helicase RecQ
VCTAPRFADPPDPALVELAQRHLRSRPIELEVKKMAPDATGAMRKIPDDVRIEPGFALARFGDGGWWPAIQRGINAGRLDDEVIDGLADIVRGAGVSLAWLAAVPSQSANGVLADAAARIASALGVPCIPLVERTESRPPQREMANAAQQAANVRGAFRVTGTPPAGRGVLLDDRRHSGWTLAMVGGQLRKAGAEAVMPLVLATLN